MSYNKDNDKKQLDLFESKEWWEEEWQNMPEFIQDDLTSFRCINVHFRNRKDVEKFSKLIGQPITPKQKAIWYPEKKIRRYAHKRYVDES
jgi:hypothetical protein